MPPIKMNWAALKYSQVVSTRKDLVIDSLFEAICHAHGQLSSYSLCKLGPVMYRSSCLKLHSLNFVKLKPGAHSVILFVQSC